MKKALIRMQEMQAFLAERGIDAHVHVTTSGEGRNHSCEIQVFNSGCAIVASAKWYSWRSEDFEGDWAEFEAKVRSEFFGWWE